MRVTVPVTIDVDGRDLVCECCGEMFQGTLEEFVISQAQADPRGFSAFVGSQVLHQLDQRKGTKLNYKCIVNRN